MPLSLERYIALRYLRRAQGRSEGHRFLRLITFISVGGVAVGVATLILALSIVRGFSQEIESKIVGFGAQIQVESFRDAPRSAFLTVALGLLSHLFLRIHVFSSVMFLCASFGGIYGPLGEFMALGFPFLWRVCRIGYPGFNK